MIGKTMLSAILLTVLAGPAYCIEMFTNFHNGENVGFPGINVPVTMYRGFGRGGWNFDAIDQIPLQTIPPIPSQFPTGGQPAHVRSNYPGARALSLPQIYNQGWYRRFRFEGRQMLKPPAPPYGQSMMIEPQFNTSEIIPAPAAIQIESYPAPHESAPAFEAASAAELGRWPKADALLPGGSAVDKSAE